MARKANLFVDKGSDFYTEITLTDDDDLPIDLSTYTGAGKIKKHFDSANSVSLSISTSNNGVVGITLYGNTSINMSGMRYVYDVELTANNNVKSRVIEGILTLNPGATS